jgi:hypothetical protein
LQYNKRTGQNALLLKCCDCLVVVLQLVLGVGCRQGMLKVVRGRLQGWGKLLMLSDQHAASNQVLIHSGTRSDVGTQPQTHSHSHSHTDTETQTPCVTNRVLKEGSNTIAATVTHQTSAHKQRMQQRLEWHARKTEGDSSKAEG